MEFLTISRVTSVKLCLQRHHHQHSPPAGYGQTGTGSTHKLVRNAGPSILSPSLSTNRWIPWTLLCTLKIWMETLSLSEVNALSSSVPAPSADISTWTDRRTWYTTPEERLGSFSPLEIVETHDDCLRKDGEGWFGNQGWEVAIQKWDWGVSVPVK